MTIDEGGDSKIHLIVDGESRNIKLMTDQVAMKNYLQALAAVAEMNVVSEPVVAGYPWPGSKDNTALSAVCFLAESSITIHCYPEKKYAFVDVFSCKNFKIRLVFTHIKKAFDMPNGKMVLLNRGLDDQTGECVPAKVVLD